MQKPEAFFVFVSLRPSECGDSRLHPHPTLSSNLLVSFFCFLPFSLLHILEFSPLGGHIKTTIFLLLSPFFIFWNFIPLGGLKTTIKLGADDYQDTSCPCLIRLFWSKLVKMFTCPVCKIENQMSYAGVLCHLTQHRKQGQLQVNLQLSFDLSELY